MPNDDALTVAREKVLDWGPDLRQPARMERFRQDVAELERLAVAFRERYATSRKLLQRRAISLERVERLEARGGRPL